MVDSSNGANGFFDPFTSMSSFAFFNPKESGSNGGQITIPPILSAAAAAFGGMNNDPRDGNHFQSMGSGMGRSGGQGNKSPTTPSYHHHNSHSPLFGGSTSPTGFFGNTGTSINHTSSNSNNAYSSSGYGNSNKFPISTFSIEDTLQQGQSRSSNESSSIFSNSDDISWNGNGNYGNNTSSSSFNSHGRNGDRDRGDRDNHRDREHNGHSSSHHRENGTNGDTTQGGRETGIIEKLLHSYGFIQCCERQARLFFHFSQFEGTIEHLKLGDPVEFEMTYDRRTGKPIASSVTKIGPEVVLSEERVTGTVTTALNTEGNGELQGRISYENRGECFFLPYMLEDIEGNVTLCSQDTVSFQIATNQRSGNLTARYVRLENPAQPVRYKGIVSAIKDNFGFIERADVAKELFFHFSETRVHEGIVVGDNIEFNIQNRNGKEVASSISKLPYGTVIFEDIGLDILKGQVLKPVDKTQPSPVTIGPTPRSETMQGSLRFRGPDRQELEVMYGEKDQKGCFTMRHGDWVEFQLAVDRRDKQQRATNIQLLEESFVVSGERREEGTVASVKDGTGYITCAEREQKVFFRLNELLDFNRAPKPSDDVEFTIIPDATSPVRHSAIRIKYLPRGTVQFEIPLSKSVQGIVIREPSSPWVSQEALAGILPSLANLGLPANITEKLVQGIVSSASGDMMRQLNGTGGAADQPQGEPGMISYQLNGINGWQQETIPFQWKDCQSLKNITVGNMVTFDIHQVRRTREIIAVNIGSMDFNVSTKYVPGKHLMTMCPELRKPELSQPEPEAPLLNLFCNNSPPSRNGMDTCSSSLGSQGSSSIYRSENQRILTPSPELDQSSSDNMLPSNTSGSGGSSSPVDSPMMTSTRYPSPDIPEEKPMTNGSGTRKYRSDSESNGSSHKTARYVMKGYIAALKDGFGFIETVAQDGEIFFHSSSLVGEFSALEVGQEVEYVVSNKGSVSGKNAADMVKPLPKGSICRPDILPTLLQGTVTRPVRGANPDQCEYTGLIEDDQGQGYPFGITSMLNKKEVVQAGEMVEFQINTERNAVNIRALRKKLRSTVEAVKGLYGFLSYELDDGKKLFFHMSEVKDHNHLNPGDEVEFVILQNPRNGKSSACSVVKLCETQRPERLLNRLSKMSVDESAPRLVVIRQPHGPDGTRGFSSPRSPRTAGILAA